MSGECENCGLHALECVCNPICLHQKNSQGFIFEGKDDFIDAIENGLGTDGDLVLVIYCRKCNAQFEIGRSGITMAILMKTKVLDYIRVIQNCKCPKCGKKES